MLVEFSKLSISGLLTFCTESFVLPNGHINTCRRHPQEPKTSEIHGFNLRFQRALCLNLCSGRSFFCSFSCTLHKNSTIWTGPPSVPGCRYWGKAAKIAATLEEPILKRVYVMKVRKLHGCGIVSPKSPCSNRDYLDSIWDTRRETENWWDQRIAQQTLLREKFWWSQDILFLDQVNSDGEHTVTKMTTRHWYVHYWSASANWVSLLNLIIGAVSRNSLRQNDKNLFRACKKQIERSPTNQSTALYPKQRILASWPRTVLPSASVTLNLWRIAQSLGAKQWTMSFLKDNTAKYQVLSGWKHLHHIRYSRRFKYAARYWSSKKLGASWLSPHM